MSLPFAKLIAVRREFMICFMCNSISSSSSCPHLQAYEFDVLIDFRKPTTYSIHYGCNRTTDLSSTEYTCRKQLTVAIFPSVCSHTCMFDGAAIERCTYPAVTSRDYFIYGVSFLLKRWSLVMIIRIAGYFTFAASGLDPSGVRNDVLLFLPSNKFNPS